MCAGKLTSTVNSLSFFNPLQIINGLEYVPIEWISNNKSTVSKTGRNSRARRSSAVTSSPSSRSSTHTLLKSSSTNLEAPGFSGSKFEYAR